MLINLSDYPSRIPKEQAIQRIMKGLGVSRQEAEEVYAYDQQVNHDSSVGALPPEKEAIARKMTHTGTRKTKTENAKKGPTVYKLDARKRKPNATKEGLVSELAAYVGEHSDFEIQNLQVPNPSQKVSFQIGDKWYTWALTEHRTKPKWCE